MAKSVSSPCHIRANPLIPLGPKNTQHSQHKPARAIIGGSTWGLDVMGDQVFAYTYRWYRFYDDWLYLLKVGARLRRPDPRPPYRLCRWDKTRANLPSVLIPPER